MYLDTVPSAIDKYLLNVIEEQMTPLRIVNMEKVLRWTMNSKRLRCYFQSAIIVKLAVFVAG